MSLVNTILLFNQDTKELDITTDYQKITLTHETGAKFVYNIDSSPKSFPLPKDSEGILFEGFFDVEGEISSVKDVDNFNLYYAEDKSNFRLSVDLVNQRVSFIDETTYSLPIINTNPSNLSRNIDLTKPILDGSEQEVFIIDSVNQSILIEEAFTGNYILESNSYTATYEIKSFVSLSNTFTPFNFSINVYGANGLRYIYDSLNALNSSYEKNRGVSLTNANKLKRVLDRVDELCALHNAAIDANKGTRANELVNQIIDVIERAGFSVPLDIQPEKLRALSSAGFPVGINSDDVENLSNGIGENITEVLNNIILQINQPQQDNFNRLISGSVQRIDNNELIFATLTGINYIVNGLSISLRPYEITGEEIKIDDFESIPVGEKRIDVFYVDEDVVLKIKKGQPSESPIKPSLEDKEIEIGFIVLNSVGQEEPENIDIIYKGEGSDDWNISLLQGWSVDSSGQISGQNSLFQENVSVQNLIFTRPSAIDLKDFNAFSFTLKATSIPSFGIGIRIRLENSVTSEFSTFSFNTNNSLNFNTSALNVSQTVVIPLGLFNSPTNFNCDIIKFEKPVTAPSIVGFYDDIKFIEQEGIDELPVVSAALEEDVFVNTLNNIQIGETLAEGLTFTDYIKKKYNQVFNPDLSEAPTFSLSISPTAIQEVGTNYTGTLTFNFNRGAIRGTVNPDGTWNASGFQNPRAGEATSYLLDGDLSPTNTASVNRTIVQGSNVFNGTVTYGEGSQPLDSNGNPFDSPLAAATSPNRTATITGRYRQFFGGSSSVPESSSDVRNLPLNNFDNVNTFTINTGTSNTIFSIAIPASKNLISVIDTGNLNANITSQYNLISSSFIVKDAGDNDVNYKLYVLQLGSPYPESTNHVITVS